ncbi:outer membrane chaperone Skp (OmpH) [Alkalidesulfovibrio alkalitolerans DSM 16529]|uniref:Outer membrane chaperone Skp (OmpH) n=1 Tax=Alkalidesulfovibrio alkalitolerans DSM 16529 TaxID=1121439 RepID=S7T1S7_9BACT|nr:OmpH family outer membrane protein [Alkalidesulfovibrio alkalitolerans]EPR30521.1 outer membrane chaperone Skp (OmpH) [Alkalidesulfovibrio alkalitolerans DSM 16529]
MRKMIMGFALLLSLAVCAPAFAADLKIGVMNLQRVVEESQAGLEVQKNLRAKFEKMNTDVEKQKTEIERMREEMDRQGMALSPEAMQDKELAFKRRVRDYQDMVMAYQRKLKSEEEQATGPVLDLLAKVVEDYAKRNSYSLILDTAGQFNNVLYNDASVDVSQDIINELNKAWAAKK